MKTETHTTMCMVLLVSLMLPAGCSKRTRVESESIIRVTSSERFDSLALDGDKPVLVEFSAAWCPACRSMNPLVAEFADTYDSTVTVLHVDVDENREVAGRFKVRALPTYLVFYRGAVIGAQEGAMRESSFKGWIKESLLKAGVELSHEEAGG